MVSHVVSAGISGIEGYPIQVECFLSNGLPSFDIVGLPDMAVKESRDRVRATVKNAGFDFPLRRITVNLAPADTKKEGTVYDLPICVGMLLASGVIRRAPEKAAFIGELSLEGALRPVNGVLPMTMALRESGIDTLFLPEDNGPEAALCDGMTIYPAKSVKSIIAHLDGTERIAPALKTPCAGNEKSLNDFADVMGQENAKRSLEIAAAGGHNILLIGPPGSGKSMLARRISSILPDMTPEEALDVTKIYSVSGMLKKDSPLICERPFRSPHHTVSAAGLAGGGSGKTPRPGEITLAHHGVLFLDEFPEFHRDAIEVLRQPVEDGEVAISRVYGTFTYPCSFMLVCAMNPCRCGWYGHSSGKCVCTESQRQSYLGRVSGPMLDRIDLHVEVPSVRFEELRERRPAEKSSVIRARVNRARDIQNQRYSGTGITCNGKLDPSLMRRHCALTDETAKLMKDAFEVLGLTARSYDRILRVARTIADLDGEDAIASSHIAEAVQYRVLDRVSGADA